jgi:hypothetical protein
VSELLNVLLLVDTWNPAGAVTVMFSVRLLPDTMYCCDVELVFTCTFPKSAREVCDTVIVGATPVPLTNTFFVVAPVLVCVITPDCAPVVVGLNRA